MVEWMSYPLYYAFDGAPPPPRTGAAHATIYPYGPFVAGDGKLVMLGLQNEREWALFCEKVLQQRRARDRRALRVQFAARGGARTSFGDIIVDAFASLTAAEVVARLDGAGIANARMNDMQEVWQHPQLSARERWTEVGSPAGPIPALMPPALPHDVTPRMDPMPALGEHSDAILRELGYDDSAIARLRADGAI